MIADDLIRHAKQATGKDQLSHGLAWLDVVNEGGQRLCSAHQWKWLERMSTPLGLVADQPWIDLPDDFGGLLTPLEYNSVSGGLAPSLPGDFLALKTTGTTGGTRFFGRLVYLGGAGVRPVFELYPTPDTDDTDAVLISYRARWVDLPNDSSPVPVPPLCLPLLRSIVRAVALGYDSAETYGTVDEQMEEILASRSFRRAVHDDGTVDAPFNVIRGGAAQLQQFPRGIDTVDLTSEATGPNGV